MAHCTQGCPRPPRGPPPRRVRRRSSIGLREPAAGDGSANFRARAHGEGRPTHPLPRHVAPRGRRGTGELKLALEPGVYELETDGDDIDPGTLTVGPQRPEGPDQLLAP
ncbi:MAG: hypothetical protein M3469_01810 [Actinomycetota bacterium]|nr:hypothetical protein [Actinomycetota bacterium]